MRRGSLLSPIVKATLFLAYFISFAAVNFEDSSWGFQVSWLVAGAFCLGSLPRLALNMHRWRHFRDKRFCWGLRALLVIFGITALAWALAFAGVTELPSDGESMTRRSLGHVGYLLFYATVFVCLYGFLRERPAEYWTFFRWGTFYPFLFISVWGIYQFLSTFDWIEYATLFNNSLSTGFTYERFKDDHRVSSIFPEPSEYSYYLALMTPLVWAAVRRKLPSEASGGRWLLLALLITQVLTVRSLSFVVALPVIAYVITRHVEGIRGPVVLVWLAIAMTALLLGVGIGLAPRLGEVASGGDGSAIERYLGLVEALDLWLRSPVVGFGYGIVRGLDALSFLLASLGLLGSLLLVLALSRYLAAVTQQASPILSGALLSMAAGFVTSNNVFSHIFFWTVLALFAACPYVQRPVQPMRVRRLAAGRDPRSGLQVAPQ